MKVLALMGSPRKKANTDLLLDEYLKGVVSTNNDAVVNKIVLQEKKIACCTSCNGCKMLKSKRCVVKDDMQEIYPLIKEADVIVLATPIYWWSMSAQLKIFIDRLYGLEEKELLKTKECVLLTTYGGALPNEGPSLVENTIKEICDYLGIKFRTAYGVCTDDEVQVTENFKALKEVYDLGASL